ncbi:MULTISPECIES: LamG domain-containing protein [unclassified Cryobacterium]|uniref:LamG domain-containing protein n=1 Tax=unclassified Cryobacterium TaxID=2649013 RepID=UPI00141A96C8|nr:MULTISPECIES: LamG domain-containing protein [unclassified Cryobacterium]
MDDAQSAPDESSASVVAEAHNHSVMVDSASTETDTVMALPDGSFQLTVNTEPIRVKQNGSWADIDTSLSKSTDGFLAPAATTVPVRFSSGGADSLAQIQVPTGEWLTETWPLGALPVPVVDAASATYPEVLPGVDLQLTATSTGMSEVLVVKTKEAAANPELSAVQLVVSGAPVAAAADGSTSTGPDTETSLRSNKPQAWDSSATDASSSGPGGGDVGLPVDQTVTGDTMSLDVAAVVAKPGLTYPVFVDPDWSGGNIHAWWINQAYPNQSYIDGGAYTDGMQFAGYVQASWSSDGRAQRAEAFWQMDASAITGRHILQARFNTTELYASSCQARPIELWSVTGVSAGMSWNGSSALGWQQRLDTQNVAHGYNSSCPAQAVGFDATPAVAAASAAGVGSVTLGMRASDENDTYSWKKFAVGATLTITYNTVPNRPVNAGFTSPVRFCGTAESPSYVNETFPITMAAYFTDSDGGNVAGRFYVVNAYNGADNKLPASIAPNGYLSSNTQAQGAQTAVLPANTLVPGFYAMGVAGWDGIDSSNVQFWCYFVVKNSGPALPGVSISQSGSSTVGLPLAATFTSNAADNVAAFEYWWTNSPLVTPSPSPPVTTGSGGVLPACGSSSGLVRFACADANGTANVTVAPVDDMSTLWVASVDKAGNVSKNSATPASTSAGLEVHAAAAPTISYTQGHGWWLPGFMPAPLAQTIPDLNTASGTGLTNSNSLTLGAGTQRTATADPTSSGSPEAAISLPGYSSLDRENSGPDHSAIVEGSKPDNYWFESVLGQLAPIGAPAPPGTIGVYSCMLSTGDEMTSLSSNCEGSGATPILLGYAWTSPPTGPTAPPTSLFYRCLAGTDHFDSLASNCEGQRVEGPMVYIAELGTDQTSRPAVDTLASFTVSAWVKPLATSGSPRYHTIMAQSGPVNSGFYLQEMPGGLLRFCIRTQAGTPTLDCATASSPTPDGSWVFVTGVWDSANSQIRLLIGNQVQPAAVASHLVPAGDVSATGVLTVGSAVSSSATVNQWSGLIVDPTIFPGVVEKVQLYALYNQFDPSP